MSVGEVESKLIESGIELPAIFEGPSPRAVIYSPIRVHQGIGYISGHGPTNGGTVLMTGRVGDHLRGDFLSQEAGYEAARMAGLSMLASIKDQLGDLDRVEQWLRVDGLIRVAEGFGGVSFVLNGISDLIFSLWGRSGEHASTAAGVSELPFNMPVWIQAVVAVSSEDVVPG